MPHRLPTAGVRAALLWLCLLVWSWVGVGVGVAAASTPADVTAGGDVAGWRATHTALPLLHDADVADVLAARTTVIAFSTSNDAACGACATAAFDVTLALMTAAQAAPDAVVAVALDVTAAPAAAARLLAGAAGSQPVAPAVSVVQPPSGDADGRHNRTVLRFPQRSGELTRGALWPWLADVVAAVPASTPPPLAHVVPVGPSPTRWLSGAPATLLLVYLPTDAQSQVVASHVHAVAVALRAETAVRVACVDGSTPVGTAYAAAFDVTAVPAVLWIPSSSSSSSSLGSVHRYTGDPRPAHLLAFVNERLGGLDWQLDGRLGTAAGRVPELDAMARGFSSLHASVQAEVLAAARAARRQLPRPHRARAGLYLQLMAAAVDVGSSGGDPHDWLTAQLRQVVADVADAAQDSGTSVAVAEFLAHRRNVLMVLTSAV